MNKIITRITFIFEQKIFKLQMFSITSYKCFKLQNTNVSDYKFCKLLILQITNFSNYIFCKLQILQIKIFANYKFLINILQFSFHNSEFHKFLYLHSNFPIIHQNTANFDKGSPPTPTTPTTTILH